METFKCSRFGISGREHDMIEEVERILAEPGMQ